MNNKKYQIFVSSTYNDLKNERQAAVEAILKMGHIPAGMELFAAGDESQMETIKRWIESSDIYMLILGGRYGSIEQKTALSYIELEYDYAISIEKPIFAVVLSDAALNKKIKDEKKEVFETEHPQEYKLFREKVLSKTCAFFDDCKDVKLAIHESIPDIQRRYELVGWVSFSDVPDTKHLLNEINRLSEENKKLLEENENLRKRVENAPKKVSKQEEYNELINVLSNIKIESILFDRAKKVPVKVRLIDIFYDLRDRLTIGITNKMGMADYEKLLYFNVCPKLQIHGLAINERIPGVQYRRFVLTKEGLNLLSYIEKNKILEETKSNKKIKKKK